MVNGLAERLLRYHSVRTLARKAYAEMHRIAVDEDHLNIPEIEPLNARPSGLHGSRINLILPAVSIKHVFGGIATALALFERLQEWFPERRIIVTDEASVTLMTPMLRSNWKLVKMGDSDVCGDTIVICGDRRKRSLPVRGEDVFVATAWWTAHSGFSLLEWQAQYYGVPGARLGYLIQDFEPAFYPWSSRYALADLTYRYPERTIPIFNTRLLAEFFSDNHITFPLSFTFEPRIDSSLRQLRDSRVTFSKTRTLLLYGRPNVERNAYALAIAGLRFWATHYEQAKEWQILSAGEIHDPVLLSESLSLRSLGKLSLSEYGDLLCTTAVGLSLMVSPHPSYPPLELAAFGAKVVTNKHANKDLSNLSSSIYSVERADHISVGEALSVACNEYESGRSLWQMPVRDVKLGGEFLSLGDPFAFASQLAEALLARL